jgi:hypothetical protein
MRTENSLSVTNPGKVRFYTSIGYSPNSTPKAVRLF